MDRHHDFTPEEWEMFEWQYRYMGDFKRALIEAICLADEFNLGLLMAIYPDMVKGYLLYSNESGWWQKVQEKAVKLSLIKSSD